MSSALKCDLCGSYFDMNPGCLLVVNQAKNDPDSWKLAASITTQNTNYDPKRMVYDLCPKCLDQVKEFVEQKRSLWTGSYLPGGDR